MTAEPIPLREREFPRAAELLREALSPAGGGVVFFSAIATRATFRVRALGFNPGRSSIVEARSPNGKIAIEVHMVIAEKEDHRTINPLRPWRPVDFAPVSIPSCWLALGLLEGP